MQNKLKKLRSEINDIDRKILIDLKHRFRVTRKIGTYKAKYNLPPQDKKREAEISKIRNELAGKFGLDRVLVEKIFKIIISSVRREHKFKIDNKDNGNKK